jgi:hypothetical protein
MPSRGGKSLVKGSCCREPGRNVGARSWRTGVGQVDKPHCKPIKANKNQKRCTSMLPAEIFFIIAKFFEFFTDLLSHPLRRLMYGEYWFRLSRLSIMVIGSFASYTKTKSVESAV